MPCNVVSLPGGGRAIVCSSGRRKLCGCGKTSTRLCDWKVPSRRSGTCDAPLCEACSHVPATEKDLCPIHAAEWKASLAAAAARR